MSHGRVTKRGGSSASLLGTGTGGFYQSPDYVKASVLGGARRAACTFLPPRCAAPAHLFNANDVTNEQGGGKVQPGASWVSQAPAPARRGGAVQCSSALPHAVPWEELPGPACVHRPCAPDRSPAVATSCHAIHVRRVVARWAPACARSECATYTCRSAWTPGPAPGPRLARQLPKQLLNKAILKKDASSFPSDTGFSCARFLSGWVTLVPESVRDSSCLQRAAAPIMGWRGQKEAGSVFGADLGLNRPCWVPGSWLSERGERGRRGRVPKGLRPADARRARRVQRDDSATCRQVPRR